MKYYATIAVVGLATAAPTEDEVPTLPEIGTPSTKTWAGYVGVESSKDKKIHYTFIQSRDNPYQDPVVIWFNGGPGCSSMLGFLQENGPYVIDDGERYIKYNPHSWNNRANMLYIDQPAGVGYSYAKDAEKKGITDETASVDALSAVRNWFKKFPEYQQNDLYVTGESYAGIYVPYLANQIVDFNALSTTTDAEKLNLKGIAVGNGCTDWNVDCDVTTPDLWHGLNIIPPDLYAELKAKDCKSYAYNVIPNNFTPENGCEALWDRMMAYGQDLNIYDLYRKLYDETSPKKEDDLLKYGGSTQDVYASWLKGKVGTSLPVSAYITEYLNRADVMEALHVDKDVKTWEDCNDTINESWVENKKGSIWIYPLLKAAGIRMLKYSGDTDGAVPTWGTRQWIHNLKWTMTHETTPWFVNNQYKGEITRYEGLDFVTVHGAGHMCPQWKRFEVTSMITSYLHGEDISNYYTDDFYGKKATDDNQPFTE